MPEELSLRAVPGRVVVVGFQPDGDSARFVPDDADAFDGLRNAERIDPNDAGAVQLRLEAIDTPETHYGEYAQPLGTAAADRLLELLGFTDVARDGDAVTASTPSAVPVTIATWGADVNGRPVSFVSVGEDRPAAGEVDARDVSVIDASLNARLLQDGSAYPTIYESLAAPLARRARELARAARDAGRGVWAVDRTARFTLRGHDDLGPGGQLILPKLFRRASDYLDSRAETLPNWLEGGEPGEQRDDEIVLGDGTRTRLSDLVTQTGDEVGFSGDLLDITVVEQ